MVNIGIKFKSAWNAFVGSESSEDPIPVFDYGSTYTVRPDRQRIRISSERTIISSIYTRLSIDVAAISIRHTRHDDSDRYLEDMPSGLNECLTIEANIDQAPRAFKQDIALTMFDSGVAAIEIGRAHV